MQLAPAVGKDSPPDLAHLVPSGVPNSSEQSVDKVTSPNVPHPNNIPKETGQQVMHDFFSSNFIPLQLFALFYICRLR